MSARVKIFKEVRDAMEDIDEKTRQIGSLSSDIQRDLQTGGPGSAAFETLQAAELQDEHYQALQKYFQDKAKQETQQLVEENRDIADMERLLQKMQHELRQLRMDKSQSDSAAKSEALQRLRSTLTDQGILATEVFDTSFLAELRSVFMTQVNTLEQRMSGLENRVAEATSSAIGEAMDHIDNGDFNRRLRRVMEILRDDQKSRVEEFREQETEFDRERATLQDRNQSLAAEMGDLEEEVKKLEQQNAQSANARKSLEQDKASIQASLEAARDKVKKSEAETASVWRDLDKRHIELTNVNRELEHRRTELGTAQEHLNQKDAELAELKLQLKQKDTDFASEKSKQERQAAESAAKIAAAVEELSQKDAELTAAKSSQERQAAESKAKLEETEQQLSQKDTELAAAKGEQARQATESASKIEETERQLRQKDIQLAEEKSNQERQVAELGSIQNQLEHESAAHTRTSTELEKTQVALKTAERGLAQQVEANALAQENHSREIADLRHQSETDLAEANEAAEEKLGNTIGDIRSRNTVNVTAMSSELRSMTQAKEQATQERDQVLNRFSSLMQLNHNVIKSRAILQLPFGEMIQIIERAVANAQDSSNIDPVKILDSESSDLPAGTSLIADVRPETYFLRNGATTYVFIGDEISHVAKEPDFLFKRALVFKEESNIPPELRHLQLSSTGPTAGALAAKVEVWVWRNASELPRQ